MKTAVCFGASLTGGRVSFNYLELLQARPALADYRFLNHGVDGDLAWSYHTGGHTATPTEWTAFLEFADRHFREVKKKK